MAREKDKKKSGEKKKGGNMPVHFFLGDLISSSFFARNKFNIILIVAMLMLYISIKYKCQTSIETIDRLSKELAIRKSDCINEKGKYMSLTRESRMQQLVDTLHLNLRVQQQPPFKLSYDEE